MIKIHIDFKDGTELSLIEGQAKGDNFTTNCLDFFQIDNPAEEVRIIYSDGSYISRNELLSKQGKYCAKQIRKEHNIQKMFLAGTFKPFREIKDELLDLELNVQALRNRIESDGIDYIPLSVELIKIESQIRNYRTNDLPNL